MHNLETGLGLHKHRLFYHFQMQIVMRLKEALLVERPKPEPNRGDEPAKALEIAVI